MHGDLIQKQSKRSTSIDSLKCICALLVVFIHCHYPYKQYVIPITDVAVPLFFVCSGYFIYCNGSSKKRLLRILYIICWSFTLYFLKTELFHIFSQKELFILSLTDIVNLVCFNNVVFSIHLWYLAAYLYVLIIIYYIDNHLFWKFSFYSIIPLLIIGIFIKQHVNKTCPEEIYYYRNFLFVGLPYVLIGAYIRHLPHLRKNKNMAVTLTIIILILIICRYYTHNNVILNDCNLFLLVISLFLLTLTLDTGKDCSLSYLGQYYSLYIYIFHLVIASSMELIANNIPIQISIYYMYINPLFVFSLSILFTWTLKSMKIIKI